MTPGEHSHPWGPEERTSRTVALWPDQATRDQAVQVLGYILAVCVGFITISVIGALLHPVPIDSGPAASVEPGVGVTDPMSEAWLAAQRTRVVAGAVFAIGLVCAVAILVLGSRAEDEEDSRLDAGMPWAAPALVGVRRLLGAVGSGLIALWVAGWVFEIALRPTTMLDAYGLVGVLMVVAAMVMRTRSPGAWIFGIAMALAYAIAAVTVLLGLVFAEGLGPIKMVYMVVALIATLGSLWSLAVLFRTASIFGIDASAALGRVSGLTVAVVLGGAMSLYTLWYGFVIDPTDTDANLDVQVSSTPVTSGNAEGFLVTFTLQNPTQSAVRVLASPLVFRVGSSRPAGSSCATNLAQSVGASTAEAECLKGWVGVMLPESISPGEGSGARADGPDPCLTLEDVSVTQVVSSCAVGDAISGGVRLEPGASTRASALVWADGASGPLNLDSWIIYAYGDRIHESAPTGLARQTQCPATADRQVYRDTSFDPITGLISAWDPVWLQVSVGASLDATRRGQTCMFARGEVTPDAHELSPVIGLAKVSEVLFPES